MTDPIRGQGTDGSKIEVRTNAREMEVRVDSNGDNRIDATVTIPNNQGGAYYLANNQLGESAFGSVLRERLSQRLPGGLQPTEVDSIVDVVKTMVMSTGPLPTRGRS